MGGACGSSAERASSRADRHAPTRNELSCRTGASSPMSKPSANLRLFVAIYPPPELSQQLIETVKQMDLPAHRLTPEAQVHMTVQFIGDTPARELDATVESVMRAASGLTAFDLTPMELIALPERGPARLIAAQTDSPPQLMELQRRLASRLATLFPYTTLFRSRKSVV